MLSAEARVPYSTVSIVLVLLSWRKCALAASKESRDGRRRPPESHRKTQKGCFSHRLTVGSHKGKGVAVNQGTAEEKRLSEMILLSGSSRLSYGLETLFIKGTTFHAGADTVLPVSVYFNTIYRTVLNLYSLFLPSPCFFFLSFAFSQLKKRTNDHS